ncbi:winged helix-turn-helix domain-containing protein [Natronoglomus mannanivorans]|uniref:winged helix-turn-helix domain-containing protein n=1 Tax=Natronoglomus mannanivorans TaxID=2979990 RepID=UPI003CCC9505
MKDVERAILRLLADSELSLTPNNIAKNTGYSNGYIRRECNRLAKEGMLEKDAEGSNPFYTITEKGATHLKNE